MPEDEARTIELARAGDPQAFEDLVRPLISPAYRLAAGMLMERTEAEDAVQESVLKAWRSIARLRGERCRPWFMAIVANHCRSRLRRRRFSALALDLVRVPSAGPESAVIAGLDIRAAMSRLSPRDRALLVLRYYEDLPVEEVSRVLGMSPTATRVALHRAVHRLRPLVEAPEAVR